MDRAAEIYAHADLAPAVNRLTGAIVDSAVRVHRALGPGLLERVYRDALAHELAKRGHVVEREREYRAQYDGVVFEGAFRLDLIVDRAVVVEIKTVEAIHIVHLAQVRTYCTLAACPVGLLLNFYTARLKDGIRRVVVAPPAASGAGLGEDRRSGGPEG